MEQFKLIIALLFMFTPGFIVGRWTEFFSDRKKCRKCEYKVNADISVADVISRKEVLELIESFKVESTHELSKSDFDRNDTLRLLQDVIKGVTWEDVL